MPGCLPMGIGDNCVIRKCIIDKNARIGSNVKIVNADNVQESNREDDGYVIKVCTAHCIVVESLKVPTVAVVCRVRTMQVCIGCICSRPLNVL